MPSGHLAGLNFIRGMNEDLPRLVITDSYPCFATFAQLGMTKYRVDRILPACTRDRLRNGTALLCTTRLIIDK